MPSATREYVSCCGTEEQVSRCVFPVVCKNCKSQRPFSCSLHVEEVFGEEATGEEDENWWDKQQKSKILGPVVSVLRMKQKTLHSHQSCGYLDIFRWVYANVFHFHDAMCVCLCGFM